MELKSMLSKQIERENEHLIEQEVGSEEYCESIKRINVLEDRMIEIEKNEEFKKDRVHKTVNEYVKNIGVGIIVPFVGLIGIMAFEKDESFTSVLKGYVNNFIPKKI